MPTRTLALTVLTLVLLGSTAAPTRAQQVCCDPAAASVQPGWSSSGTLSAPISAGGIIQESAYPSQPQFPYSYFAAYPSPAREYVPYGQNDIFSFDGRAYGHAYDRYSWTHLAGYNNLMNRYYYPPLR